MKTPDAIEMQSEPSRQEPGPPEPIEEVLFQIFDILYRRLFRLDKHESSILYQFCLGTFGTFAFVLFGATLIGQAVGWGAPMELTGWGDWVLFILGGMLATAVFAGLLIALGLLAFWPLLRFRWGCRFLASKWLGAAGTILGVLWALSVVQNTHDYPRGHIWIGEGRAEEVLEGSRETLVDLALVYGGFGNPDSLAGLSEQEIQNRHFAFENLRKIFLAQTQLGIYRPVHESLDSIRRLRIVGDSKVDRTVQILEQVDEEGYSRVVSGIGAGLGYVLLPLYFWGRHDRETEALLEQL